ncbi:MAG: TlyA family RNA methyltransferase [Clostridiales bacterium]|jgi:23S rRNA (cytidine1920-2'-O)/16S rRNA (cytidine1409-2'-O)-methyltransferase|nr:TlyA family RNA methyltransferase [Clostridiales bacterium]
MRLDVLMFERQLTPSREKARALVMAGKVHVDGKPAQKAGMQVLESAGIQVMENPLPYVGRGGLKLKKAVDHFSLSLSGVTAADIGASTGGFTDCMLQHGAAHVYAIDVGYGQLDWRLRNDPRVTVMERRNARYMEPDWFLDKLQFAGIDVSFISLKLILPALYPCLSDDAYVAMLIKPQFEAGKNQVQKHGVIKDPAVHRAVIKELCGFAQQVGFSVCGLTCSPITGPKGNIEFLCLLKKSGTYRTAQIIMDEAIKNTVREAHETLKM